MSRLQSNWSKEEISKTINDNFGLNDLDIGPPIAKGCAAVVYAAALKDAARVNAGDNDGSVLMSPPQEPYRHEIMSPIQNTSRFVHNFGGSVDNVHFNTTGIHLDLMSSPANENLRSSIGMRQRFDSITESVHEQIDGAMGAPRTDGSESETGVAAAEKVSEIFASLLVN